MSEHMAQTCPKNFFILTLRRHFTDKNVKDPTDMTILQLTVHVHIFGINNETEYTTEDLLVNWNGAT